MQERISGTYGQRKRNWEEESRHSVLPADSEQTAGAILRRCNVAEHRFKKYGLIKL